MNEYGVILFFTTSSAIRSEKILKKEGYIVKLIPTPRQFSSDCGIALSFIWEEQDSVERLLSEAHVEIDAVRKI
jgi:hypothetical protein